MKAKTKKPKKVKMPKKLKKSWDEATDDQKTVLEAIENFCNVKFN